MGNTTNSLAEKSRLRQMIDSYGVPRMIITGFLLLMFVLVPFAGVDFATQISNVINRFSWNAIMVLAMVPGIQCGIGLNMGLAIGIVCGLFGGIAGQMGDLFASMVKRHCRIKDFGHIFPGHGGMLDRLDSIVFTAIIVYSYRVILLASI